MGQTISISTRHGRISAWQAKPHDKPRGAIIVVQEIFGVNSHIRQVADRFANYGYLAIAPALFDLVHPGTELGYDEDSTRRGRDMAAELGFDRALDGVRGDPPLDVRALADIAVAVGAVIAGARGAIASVDLNPVMVGAAGDGAVVVDALVECAGADGRP